MKILDTQTIGLVFLFWMVFSANVWAHGLLVSVRSDGDSVIGNVYYSDGDPGAGEWVEMTDLTVPETEPQSAAAGPDGEFRFDGVEGHRYRISVKGGEGHRADSEIELAPKARGTFVETDASEEMAAERTLPPAWAILGGLLLLSMIPALWLRRRARRRAP